MTYQLPTILEAVSTGGTGGLQVADSSGTSFYAKIWRVDGTTAAAYNRTLLSVISGDVLRAMWRYYRMGGPGEGLFVFQGGIADLDVAVQGEYELEIVRGGTGASGTTWYRGRIVRYAVALDATGTRVTTIMTEGYAAKLREIVFSATIAAGQTVAQAVATIMSTYVTPNTRIRFNTAADIRGSYVLSAALVFKDADVLSTMHKLAMLQGDTEWGVTEGGTGATDAPAFYFNAASASKSETAVFIAGADVKQMDTAGTFRGALNNVNVIGGIVSSVAVTGTSSDSAAQTAYGKRYATVVWAALQGATDANRLAANYVSFYKDGNGSYSACRDNPSTRLEPDRTNSGYGAGTEIPSSPQATWFGDSSKVTAPWSTIEYTYEPGCPIRFTACGHGGLFEETADALLSKLSDAVDTHTSMFRQMEAASDSGSGVNPFLFTQTADKTVTGTAAETSLVGTGVGDPTLPINFLTAGMTIRLRAKGYYSTAGTPGQVAVLRFKLGSTVITASGNMPMSSSINQMPWSIDVELTCRSTGSGGTVYSQSQVGFDVWTAATTLVPGSMVKVATVTIDTTATQLVDLTWDWLSSAADTVTCTNLTVEALDPTASGGGGVSLATIRKMISLGV